MANLGQIRGNVQRNLTDTATNKFYSVAELNQYIGEAFRHFTLTMIEKGEGYFKNKTNLPLDSGVEEISLAFLSPYFFSISKVERNTSGYRIPLQAYERRFEINGTNFPLGGTAYTPTYRLINLDLILEPAPQFTEIASDTTGLRLEYNYVPDFPNATSLDSFAFDITFSTMYEPMIELYATIAALESKDGSGGVSDVNSFRNRLSIWEQRFEKSLTRFEYPDSVQSSNGNSSLESPYYY